MRFGTEQPATEAAPESSHELVVLRTVEDLWAAIPHPASQPGFGCVLEEILRCFEAVFELAPRVAVEFAPLYDFLRALAAKNKPAPLQLAGLGQFRARFQAWCLFASLTANTSTTVRTLLGIELLLATRRKAQFRKPALEIVTGLCNRTLKDPERKSREESAVKYQRRLLKELSALCDGELRGLPPLELALLAEITACLSGRVNDANGHAQAQGIRKLARDELHATLHTLSRETDRGSTSAAGLLWLFRMNLPWLIAKRIPLAPHQLSASIAWIDTRAGCIFVDLSGVLIAQARVRGPQFKSSSRIIRLRVPANAANVLHEAYCRDASARCLGDLLDDEEFEALLTSIHGGAIRVTLARLMASAGPSALEAGVHSAIAAFLTLAFQLVGRSALAYFNAEATEFHKAEEVWLGNLGLTPPIAPTEATVSIGAAATPALDAVRKIYELLVDTVEKSRPGRNCGLARLFAFHDAFATLFAFTLVLCFGSRKEAPIRTSASDFGDKCRSAMYQHKRVGPNLGFSLLPVPSIFAEELELWFAHLLRLDGRLARLKEKTEQITQIRSHIARVLTGEEPLLFFLTGGLRLVASSDIFAGVPPELRLTCDFARHLIPNIRHHEDAHAAAEAWMRHHGRGRSHFSTESLLLQGEWMSQMAASIDRLCGDLHIRPVRGLGKMK